MSVSIAAESFSSEIPEWYACPLPLDEGQPASPPPQPQKWRSTPLTPGATLLYFDPALAMEIGETKAIILQKVWDWMECNRIDGKMDKFIDGEWYTYNSAKQWRDNHFWHLSVATVKKAFQELEDKGYLKRIQHYKEFGDCRMWTTIPAEARARIDALSISNTPSDKKYPRGDKNPSTLGEKISPTNKNHQIKNHQTKNANTKQQQQPAAETDVVVVPPALPHREPSLESGEHCLEGEGADTTAVKAFVPHEQHHDEQPFPKVPQKGFPAAPALAAKMARTLGFEVGFAQTLIRRHGAALIRAHAIHAEKHTTIHTPPAWMRIELEQNELGLAPVECEDWDTAEKREAFDPLAYLASLPIVNYETQRIADLEAREHIPPLPEPVGLDEKPDGSMSVREIWLCAHDQMRLLFGSYEFDTMLKDAQLFSYEQGAFRIGVRSAIAQDMLQHRYYRNVQRIIEGLHNSPVNLVFEVCPSLANPHQRPLSASEIEELHRLRADRALV